MKSCCLAMDMSQSFVASPMKDVGNKNKRQRGGCRKPLTNVEMRHCITFDFENQFETTSHTTKQLHFKKGNLLIV